MVELLKTWQNNICSKYQDSPEMGLCISGEWNHWIRNKEEEDGHSSQSLV